MIATARDADAEQLEVEHPGVRPRLGIDEQVPPARDDIEVDADADPFGWLESERRRLRSGCVDVDGDTDAVDDCCHRTDRRPDRGRRRPAHHGAVDRELERQVVNRHRADPQAQRETDRQPHTRPHPEAIRRVRRDVERERQLQLDAREQRTEE